MIDSPSTAAVRIAVKIMQELTEALLVTSIRAWAKVELVLGPLSPLGKFYILSFFLFLIFNLTVQYLVRLWENLCGEEAKFLNCF